MRIWVLVILLLSLPVLCDAQSGGVTSSQTGNNASVQMFSGNGVILAIRQDEHEITVRHEAIPHYMGAMTMPFKVKDGKALDGLRRGDQISFQLCVTANKSWIEKIVKIGQVSLGSKDVVSQPVKAPATGSKVSLLDYKFTNELGQAVSLNDFRGQALAITFFYTRCPLPDYCPRLSRNFEEASEKLEQITNLPANWHFISVSFDPAFDTPQVLKNYGESYHYNSGHWTFLTGPPDKIAMLAHAAGVEYEPDDGTINHNFRTLIVDPQSRLQAVFPVAGDLSEQIASQIIRVITPQTTSKSGGRAG